LPPLGAMEEPPGDGGGEACGDRTWAGWLWGLEQLTAARNPNPKLVL
jgi:hypothetical protein